jgi:hypothetical protein
MGTYPEDPTVALNQLRTIQDLQAALADASLLGFNDNVVVSGNKRRPRRTGNWIAQKLLSEGCWTKKHERALKNAYIAGFDHAYHLGVGPVRRITRRRTR